MRNARDETGAPKAPVSSASTETERRPERLPTPPLWRRISRLWGCSELMRHRVDAADEARPPRLPSTHPLEATLGDNSRPPNI